MEALGINAGLLLIQIIGFILLVLLLRGLLYQPLLNALEARRERIAEGLNNAREAEQALARAETDRQALLDEARAEAQRITAEARARAEEAARALIAEARAEAQRIREQAQTEATGERDRQLAEMRDQIIALSLAAANHLIGANLDEKKQRQVIEDFFAAVPVEARRLGDSMTVITALPLTDAEKAKFTRTLGGAEVAFRVDPSILGGVVLRSGAQEIDASYRAQLAGLRASLS